MLLHAHPRLIYLLKLLTGIFGVLLKRVNTNQRCRAKENSLYLMRFYRLIVYKTPTRLCVSFSVAYF